MKRGLKIPPSIISTQRFPSIVKRLINTSLPDNITGFIDPNLILPDIRNSLDNNPAEEFAFLRDSLLDTADVSLSETKMVPGKHSHEAYLISSAIRNNNDDFGDNTLKILREYRHKLNESLVVDVLNLIQNGELGVKFFIWANRQIGYSHSAAVYNALLDLLGSEKNDRISDQVFRDIKEDDKEVLKELLNVLIRKCCKNGKWNVALAELGRLKDLGFKPSRVTYNALVQVFLEADKLETVNLLHRELSTLGFQLNIYTLGHFAYALCKTGKWREALELIEKEEYIPDTIIYTRMISGLCEASYFEEAMDFLNRMRSNSCIPNIVTYRILLCGCLNKQKLGRCKRILSMMIAEGCYPSPSIFNSLVSAYCKSGDYSYAYKLLAKMSSCCCKPGYVVYNILIGGICGNEDLPSLDLLELAENIYSEMLVAGAVLNKINVSNFARCLAGAGKFEKAFNVIREMMSKGFMPDTSTYSNVIGYLCKASKVEKAFLLFKEMKKNGVVPDVYTYTILINSFCKAGLIKQARIWFDEMVNFGCAPNVVTYTALIHSYLKERKISTANELFEKMLANGCVPNIITYTALIDGHCKAGETEKACRIYDKLRGTGDVTDVDMYFSTDVSGSLDPNVVTYGALVDGLCKVHKVKEAKDLLVTMYEEDCEPNHIVYAALIDGFCKVGKLDEAQEVFAKMSESGYNPNVYTYSSLIDRLFRDKRLDLALRVLSKMLEKFCPPNVVIYTVMIDGLCKIGKINEAYKLMTMMQEKGCKPNVVTFTAMIDGYGKAANLKKCLEIFRQMSCAPNDITYRVLINHCCKAGFLDDAHHLLDEMKQTYWPKHIGSYKKVIEGYNRNFISSLGLLYEMSANKSASVVPVYTIMIDSFRKAGRLEKALELHKDISSSIHDYSYRYKTNTYHSSLIESLVLSSKIDEAVEVYSDMIRIGGIPKLSVVFNLVKGLIKVDRWDEALSISHSLCLMDIQWSNDD